MIVPKGPAPVAPFQRPSPTALLIAAAMMAKEQKEKEQQAEEQP